MWVSPRGQLILLEVAIARAVTKSTCELRPVTVTPGACTVTVAVPVFVVSTCARAVIVTVPGCDGAVKRPVALMLPALLVHVTA